MNYILKIVVAIVTVFSFTTCEAQIKNAKTETVKISGNCGMCKNTIETAGNKKKAAKVDWNSDSKIATLIYDPKTTTPDEILKRIALAGYDNEKYLAPDDAYSKLHGCCKYERKNTLTASTPPKENKPIQDSIKKETIDPLTAVYTAYFELKDALVLTNGAMASTKAASLFKAIDKVDMTKLTAVQHTVWMKYMEKLSYDAEHIKGVTETDHQREHFSSLSKNMFEVMKVIKPAYPIYFDYCSMYNDGKGGNWISKESAIKNPFYGNQMLSCGKTIETVK